MTNLLTSSPHHRYGLLGAKFASQSVVVSCALFFLIEDVMLYGGSAIFTEFYLFIIPTALSSLFALPFAALGGYGLGWLFHKFEGYKLNTQKAVAAGALVAALSVIAIFFIGRYTFGCLLSHGQCNEEVVGYVKKMVIQDIQFDPMTRLDFVFMYRFLKALFFGLISGGVTGWRLKRVEPDVSNIPLGSTAAGA